ncbi:MAG: bifunctional fucokinase/fucose-1-phosphate guanylyltransferase [Acidobacteriota bacterium]|mgnify:CR=1 FL=1
MADEHADLAAIARRSRAAYVERIAGSAVVPWWTAVILTASSARQAERYDLEIRRRREQGKVPSGVLYLAVADLDDQRMGSGGATINALGALAETAAPPRPPADWWKDQRVLMLHSGGDSRRLPQYSLSGKLFSALPVATPWGEPSTVFDEMLALSTAWAGQLPAGVVVASGDVILTFDASGLGWHRAGVCGVAIRQPAEIGSRHGVYVAGEQGRVYAFLQKPSAAQVRAAGGMLPNDEVALDTGLLRFDPALAAGLSEIALDPAAGLPVIDLYEHVTLALTGQWSPPPDAHPAFERLAEALRGVPFWCALVEGNFTHVGATPIFRQLLTEETAFSRLYEAHQRVGMAAPPGVRSAGVIIDSVLSSGELGPGAVAIECDLEAPVRAGRGAIIHGLSGLAGAVEVPEDTVVHQVRVALPGGGRGVVIRVYGVNDDPKRPVAGEPAATWLGHPMLEVLHSLEIDPEAVWPAMPEPARTLWNAELFPVSEAETAWACARWMMGLSGDFNAERWRAARRLSLAASARLADTQAMAEARAGRIQANWRASAVSLAQSGTDIRPLLARAPGLAALAGAGRALSARATELVSTSPTEAASQYFQAGLFLAHAGLAEEAEGARASAFDCVRRGVELGVSEIKLALEARPWQHEAVTVSAPPRIDLGGGWSDTPPFCLDWGGTVLNIALELNGRYPIHTTVSRLADPLVRCVSQETGEAAEYRTAEELLAPPSPGCPFSIPRVAVKMFGMVRPGEPLAATLAALGGGLEIRTMVDLPMGSGLGTSSILAATVLRALAEISGIEISSQELSDQVMRLEQLMTTGGGWQDQAGAIFPGAKLVMSGPGLRQRLRVEPLGWSAARQAEFAARFVLYYTGIRRIAKDLLTQVVGGYLAREVAVVQVLHSIKTLASEMAHAMREGEWDHLGELLARHWKLNQILDPHTTNAPINALLDEVRPWLAGAKLAGAGGGGFLLLLARSPEAAAALRSRLSAAGLPGARFEYAIAEGGLRVQFR